MALPVHHLEVSGGLTCCSRIHSAKGQVVVVALISLAMSALGTVVSYVQQAQAAAAAQASLGAVGAGLVAVQLATAAVLSSQLSGIKSQLLQMNNALQRLEVTTLQTQRVQLAEKVVPIWQAFDILEELAHGGLDEATVRGKIVRTTELLEQGRKQVEAALQVFSGREVLELAHLLLPLLAALEVAAVCQVGLKAGQGLPVQQLQLVLTRHQRFLDEFAAKLKALPRFDLEPPSLAMLAMAKQLGHRNPSRLREGLVASLSASAVQCQLAAKEIAGLLPVADDGGG